jgi:hypothetical protein
MNLFQNEQWAVTNPGIRFSGQVGLDISRTSIGHAPVAISVVMAVLRAVALNRRPVSSCGLFRCDGPRGNLPPALRLAFAGPPIDKCVRIVVDGLWLVILGFWLASFVGAGRLIVGLDDFEAGWIILYPERIFDRECRNMKADALLD